jgi:transposase
LLVGIWVPPKPVRDLRALIAQRWKMVRLATVAKNRLHSALHRHHLDAPKSSLPFSPKQKEFWLNLPVSALERANIQCDWETIELADRQKALLEESIAKVAAEDERVPLLVQLPGIGMIGAMTLLAAIGDTLAPALARSRKCRCHSLCQLQRVGGLCWARHARARQRPSASERPHHQDRAQGHSAHHGRSCAERLTHSPALESRVGPA